MIHTIKEERSKRKKKKRVEYSSELTSKSLRYQKFGAFCTDLSLYPSYIRYNLTISETKNFIWFRVAKVGTRTIMHLLVDAGVELSAEHSNDCYYPVNLYKDYFKFGFVRNPWDRIVSCWLDKIVSKNAFRFSQEQHEELQTFEKFVDYVRDNVDLEYGNRHMRLQSRLIDLNQVDYLGRFESFSADLQEVMRILDIEGEIKTRNASQREKDYRTYYSDRVKEKVAELYKRDIQLFNYEF